MSSDLSRLPQAMTPPVDGGSDPLNTHVRKIAMLIEECSANLRLMNLISDHAFEINQNGLGMALGYLQTQSSYLAATRISNMFKTSSRNKLHSIPHLLKRLRSAHQPSDTMWREELVGLPDSIVGSLLRRRNLRAVDVIDLAEQLLSRRALRIRVQRCTKARDTWIAHADASARKWPDVYTNDISYPLNWAKHYISIVGIIWCNTSYGSDQEPFVDMGAAKIAASFKRLLVRANVVRNELT